MSRVGAGFVYWLLLALPASAGSLHQPDSQSFDGLHALLANAEVPAALQAAAALVKRHPQELAPRLHQVFCLFWGYLMDRDRQDLAQRGEQEAVTLREQAESLLHSEPRDPLLLYCAGMAAQYEARFKGLRGAWWGAISAARASHGLLQDAIRADPGLADAHCGLAIYDIAMDVLPGYFKILRAFLFLPAGNLGRGMKGLREAASSATCQRLEARVMLAAFTLEFENRAEESRKWVDQLVRDYPDNPWFQLWQASQLQLLDRNPSSALKQLARVDELLARRDSPFDRELVARVAVERACAHLELGESADAEQALGRLLDSGVERPFVVVGTARWLLARLFLMRGATAAAREQVQQITSIDELKDLARGYLRHPPAPRWGELDRRAALARHRAAGGNQRAAEAALAEADRRLGANPVTATQRASWRLAAGDWQGARALVARWREDSLEDAPAWIQAELFQLAARIAELEGQRDQARKLYDRVLERAAPAENLYARARLARAPH